MLSILSKLFGYPDEPIPREVLEKGTIVDVRTRQEFRQRHLDGSINIPLQELDEHVLMFRKMDQPVITCCRSGNRSGMAARRLKAHGVEAVNGGRWDGLRPR